MKYPVITVIVPTLNEIRHIAGVLEALIAQDYSAGKRQILVVDGMSTDGTRDVIRHYSEKHSEIEMIDNPGHTAPKALNIGIRMAVGDVVIRMDAHCIYPFNYISTLVNHLHKLKADNVGAGIRTLPGATGLIPLAISLGMSHRFGVGNSVFRVGTTETMEVDTVPFGCYRRDVFERIGLFDEELIRNQDDELNARLIRAGGHIFIIGGLQIDYYARETLGKAARMFSQYGLFKPLVNKKLGGPATMRQMIPPLFVAAWLFSILWFVFSPLLPYFLISFLSIIYCLPSLLFGAQAAYQNGKPALFIMMPLIFGTFHFAYGLGYWKGIFRFYLFPGKTNTEIHLNR